MRLSEFFAMEANDYLERLDAAVSKGAEPERDEFVRLARALRGSALMANQQAFAGAAGALERLARAARDGSRPWDAATKQLAVRAVDDLKVLVRRATTWSEDDTRKAEQLAHALHQALGGAAPVTPPKAGGAGMRAVVAQQGTGLASALEQAARQLEKNPAAVGALQSVVKTMQPMRGMASLADYPPLPDLLDGIERAVRELSTETRGGEAARDLLRAAAQAVARVAQDIAAKGQADPDAHEAHEFARRLSTHLGLASAVVPIETLFYPDAGPHIVHEGAAPVQPGKLGNLELVSHGDHLRQAADALERAVSSVQRELRAHALVATFHTLATAGGGALGDALAAFAAAARDAVARGDAVRDAKAFAHHMREVGTALSGVGSLDDAQVASRLGAVTAALASGAATLPAGRSTPAPSRGAPHRPPAPSATVTAPAASRPDGARGLAAGGDGAPVDPAGLIGAYVQFERLVTTLGMGAASLDQLLAGPPTEAAETQGAESATRADRDTPVSIGNLCYSGDAALARALSLRGKVRVALADPNVPGATLNDLIEEIFDLVQLGTGHQD